MTSLSGKVAVVTGASRGIGEAIAKRFSNDGATVINASTNERTHHHPSQIHFEHVDVRSEESVYALTQRVAEKFGKIDVVVNNAGIEIEKSVINTSVTEWDQVMAVNVRGTFLVSKHAIPHLARTRGVIINMASINAYWAEPDLAVYCASKAAVLQLTRCMALDHASQGIRSVAICPGYVRTDMLEQYYESQPDPDKVRASLTGKQPLQRLCEPNEVAGLASWLASDEASFTSGQPFIIDGALSAGRTFSWQ